MLSGVPSLVILWWVRIVEVRDECGLLACAGLFSDHAVEDRAEEGCEVEGLWGVGQPCCSSSILRVVGRAPNAMLIFLAIITGKPQVESSPLE